MPEDIEIYELKKMDIRGATVIDGFPSVGLVSSIVANYLINTLNLTQIGMMDSMYFPTVSLVTSLWCSFRNFSRRPISSNPSQA
jgi:predicted ATP-grasp superfamily ATP-dependent carboligase